MVGPTNCKEIGIEMVHKEVIEHTLKGNTNTFW